VGKSERKRPLGRPRRRSVDNRILERWDGVMWTGLVWLRIGSGGKLSSGLTSNGLSSSAHLHRVS
jgi:hypothetical protein